MNQRFRRAVEWLSAAAPDPVACAWRWHHNEMGTELLPAGRLWDVFMLPVQPGLLVLGALLHGPRKPGPVLADFDREQVGFFVPPQAMTFRVGAGSRLAGRGTWIVVPRPGHRVHGIQWLLPPDGEGTLNEPGALEAALHATAALTGDTAADDNRYHRRGGGARAVATLPPSGVH
ncbi:hypothetical protein ABIA33_002773 [Streptacidiphilus sp. MAP12-16]|uniref:hypothetical protein n=1 Tax=Streptacidiphilus sp. MAP12-16 TaxID=3156300 RepID=UPI0035151C32